MSDDEDEEMEDDDEETLRLQLQAIEAKLKLKKLQAKKKQSSSQESEDNNSSSITASPRRPRKLPSLLPSVQIPVSPVKRRFPVPEAEKQQTSPARVLLGIDKGLKAKDVSLKRPRLPTHLSRNNSTASSTINDRPKLTFSERIAAQRLSNEQQEAKADRIHQARSEGFGLPSTTQKQSTATRSQPTNPTFRKPNLSSNPTSSAESPFVTNKPKRSIPASALPVAERYSVIDGDSEGKSTEPSEDGSAFESFSALHLTKRNIPHTHLLRSLDDKEIYTLPRLLKDVKAPHYDPPDCESDFVVFAIIASKSTPYNTKPKHQMNSSTEPDMQDDINPRNKFMVMTLTDLKWEVDLFLFDTAFTQFWKLTPGTLIAILNPGIMPPKNNQHNGRFSLKLASSEDSVLEIGPARDLGFCESLQKDSKECGHWVNKRKTKYCDYHVELAVEKTRKGRMEVNSMYRPNSAVTGNKPFRPNSRAMKDGEFARKTSGARSDYLGGQYFMGGKTGLSAAKLFDADDIGKAEAMRKRLAAREKERKLGEALGRLGNGIGAEYLRSTTATNAAADASSASTFDRNGRKTTNNATAPDDDDLGPDALSLLTKRSAADVSLARARGTKRPFASTLSTTTNTSSSTTATASREAMGWGGANRRLPYPSRASSRPPSPEKGQLRLPADKRDSRDESPRKRARFALEGKGLREPGRDSLGDVVVQMDARGRRRVVERAPESSDDDLDIV